MILSGEFHPFSLPVPSLWPDVLQKIKALGFNCVSFYVDWALLEGNPGEYSAKGPFAIEPFLDSIISSDVTLPGLDLHLPNLNNIEWQSVDRLPELEADYDDSRWTAGNHPLTNNTLIPYWTPVSLYAGDYGYHSGLLIYRGTFNSTGQEQTLALWTHGGVAFSGSVWLENDFLGSHFTNLTQDDFKQVYNVTAPLQAGKTYTFTVVVLNNGLDHNWIDRYEI